MGILKIARMGHPALLKPALPVQDFGTPGLIQLINDMIETLADAGGVGLAAPQVHVARRLVILHVPAERAGEGEEPEPLSIMINPEIVPVGDEKVLGWEACLSVPGMIGAVPRFREIIYRWADPAGEQMEREASGFHARVVQHECDHLDGMLYPMRMTDMSQFGFAEEINRNRELLNSIREGDGEEEFEEDGEE